MRAAIFAIPAILKLGFTIARMAKMQRSGRQVAWKRIVCGICDHRSMDELPRITLSGDMEGDYVVLAQRAGGVLKIAAAQPDGAPVVVALEKTCTACPSQWKGSLEDGRTLYARYRGGALSVGVGEGLDEAVHNGMSEEAFYFDHVGDGLDGFMNFEELRTHLYGLLDFPEDLEVKNEREWGEGEIDLKWLDGLWGSREDDSGSGDAPPQSET
jgi:hypothetical protein